MKTDIFEPMVIAWSSQLSWTRSELNKATKLLLEISKANGGEIAPDKEINKEKQNEFAIRQANDALLRRTIPYVKSLKEKLYNPRYSESSKSQPNFVLPDLVKHEWKECVDINSADFQALKSLPGIGRKAALHIIELRNQRGGFDELEQLKEIKGIGEGRIEELSDKAFCGTSTHITFMTRELSDFIADPSFQNYVALIAETRGSFVWSANTQENPKKQIIIELKKTLEDVKANPYGTVQNLKFTRASSVIWENKVKESAKKIINNGVTEIECGALLYDNQYLHFLSKLLEQAKKSITVMMFFLRYDDEKDYISNSLVETLIKAHKNGLNVKVILDKDAEGDVIGSRFINEPVFQVLKKNKVPVQYDWEDRMTHSKFVIVDGSHVVIGSHNWTGGSFLAYDDTSIYIESKELGQKYEAIFNNFWDEYSITEESPNPQSVKCIEESKTGRNLKFQDVKTKKVMTTREFCDAIEKGAYTEYHVRRMNGKRVPASNPNTKFNLD